MFLAHKLHIDVYAEVIDVADVLKRVAVHMKVEFVERAKEIHVLVGWKVYAFIPYLSVVAGQFALVPVAWTVFIGRGVEAYGDAILISASPSHCGYYVPNVCVGEFVFFLLK